jgi:hypothetical protein
MIVASGLPVVDYGSGWGPLMVAFYHHSRRLQRGEARFWTELASRAPRVLEIGAGLGIVSELLLATRPERLTLVEPEVRNVAALRRLLMPRAGKTTIDLVTGRFADRPYDEHDLVAMPYDTLPMIASPTERRRVFEVASKTLSVGGVFAFHFRDGDELERRIDRRRAHTIREMDLPEHGRVTIQARYEAPERGVFVKRATLTSHATGVSERYAFPTALIRHEEVRQFCQEYELEVMSTHSEDGYGEVEEPAGHPGVAYVVRRRTRGWAR